MRTDVEAAKSELAGRDLRVLAMAVAVVPDEEQASHYPAITTHDHALLVASLAPRG